MQPLFALELASVAEVARITEAWYDVFVLVQSLVDRCTPDGCLVFWESLLYMLDSFWSGKDARHVDMLWITLGKERLHTPLHVVTGREH